jgi:L-asparaginase
MKKNCKREKVLIIVVGDLQDEIKKLYKSRKYDYDYDVYNYIVSEDIKCKEWNEIANIIFENYLNYSGFIVLHNAEILTYTATALSFILENLNKTVLFTTDVITGLNTIKKYNFIPEVVVIEGENILRACRSKRIKNKFISPNCPLLCKGNEVNVEEILKVPKEPLRMLPLNVNKKILIIKIYPGISINDLKNITIDRIHGVILESYGNGYDKIFVEDFIKFIKVKLNREMIVVSVSQSMGVIDDSLEKIGVICAKSMTIEAVYIKLLLILSHVKNYNNQMVGKLIDKSLRGEI